MSPTSRAPSLTDRHTESLRRMILTGELRPGEVVVEPRLAELFESSKTPVREALKRLADEGLISVLPKKGYLVRPMTPQDLAEVLDMRMLLEPHAAAEAARLADGAVIERLRDQLQRQDTVGEDDPLGRTEHARCFHSEIARAARSTRLEAVLLRCFEEMVRAHHVLPELREHLVLPDEIDEHEEILSAIAEARPERAETAMRRHLRTIHGSISARMTAGSSLWRT
ncbi:GntR family transcriptional regulator [Nesterenkonia marinintestina]|uniref:GntR family transcriptional regulator n=1 Tax=Nesterenkonia marinintestina TaxID=2979865 RepID=UPI0021BE6668|nr:GntR family transcriptional regulator [Nesterenkonia sp. GX14115]